MARMIRVEVDGPTARLIKVAQAVQASGRLPDASARRLTSLARSVRLYGEAWEHAEASAACQQIIALGAAAEDEAQGVEALLTRHAGNLAGTFAKMPGHPA